jgi:hypothetical protein
MVEMRCYVTYDTLIFEDANSYRAMWPEQQLSFVTIKNIFSSHI